MTPRTRHLRPTPAPGPQSTRPAALRAAALLLGLALLPATGLADTLPSTPADFRQLPAYCAARLEKAGPEAFARWNEIIGPNFIHMHHYCFGLHKRRLAMREPDPAERRRLVRSAIGEITYVESHAVGDIPFYAEIFTIRGKLHLMLDEKAQAASYFKRAIARDPRHGPAYGALARMLKDEGRMDQARRVIAEGVRVAPDSPSLRKLAAQYGVSAKGDAGAALPAPRQPDTGAPDIEAPDTGVKGTDTKAAAGTAATP
jgi:tetratricopeptide (TPR) repeat protein